MTRPIHGAGRPPTPASVLIVLALAVLGCAPRSALLSGRVVLGEEPLAGARVAARTPTGEVAAEAVTDAAGVYRFPPLAPGSYRVEARADRPRELEAIAGKNPVHLAPGVDAWVGLQAIPRESPGFRRATETVEGFGSLSGTVLHGGRPVEGAVVYLYLDEIHDLKGPGFLRSFPSGSDGAYALDEVPEGFYHLVVRKRRTGGFSGPVREGDLYAAPAANPVPVRSGEETVLTLHAVRKERDDDPNAELLALTGTGIRGRVLTDSGHPVSGVYVFAYRDRTIGHGMPDFLTRPTGADGAFSLSLGEGGLFYVGARERSGGSPAPGERFGFYEGSPDHGILVPRGRIVDGMEIVVREVLER